MIKRLSSKKHHQGLRDKHRNAARARALLGAHLIHFKMRDLPDSRLGARSGRYNDLEDGQTDSGLAEELSVLHDEECQLKITTADAPSSVSVMITSRNGRVLSLNRGTERSCPGEPSSLRRVGYPWEIHVSEGIKL